MALQLDFNLNGNLIKDSYVVVDNVSGNKKEGQMIVIGYYDESKIGHFASMIYSLPIDVSEGSENFIKQGYLYLKLLPGFEDSKDI